MVRKFCNPRDIYFGPGAIEFLKELKGKKALLITGGSSLKKSGYLDKILGYLGEAKIETKVFDGVEPDPSVETVFKGAKLMQEFGPDWIVAIGGGSPIDAAKAMWVFYEYPDAKFDVIKEPFAVPVLRNKAKFLAISTTSGTATEVTAFSVITDYSTHIKYPLADYNLTPDIAIVDPDLTQSMPPKLVAFTGMDALTHAIEAYVAGWHSPFSDSQALYAIELIFKNLEKSYKGDKAARETMHYAQCLAGIAFTNALLGIVHSMAHKTGAVFKIPHGCANALYLPQVIQYNSKEKFAIERFADIARRQGLSGSSEQELTNSLVAAVRGLSKKLDIPATLKDFGVPEDLFKEKVRLVSERSLTDACTGSNPRKINADQMEKLFWAIYKGEDVDF
ncbi:MAG: iron-containing alcohol dehydrogenase [Deltaproteobacteria bacterium]|jgi:alcohol dehydrogenase class IV|nr:iron-containing alcohol dehydrogenase [Deltaproteobacteria bacterium]